MTDDQFIDGIKIGDRKVESVFYKLHYHMVKSIVQQNSGTSDDAKDIYQESILAVFYKIRRGELDHRSASLKTYLYSVAKNKWNYHLREIKKVDMIVLDGEYSFAEVNDEKQVLEDRHNRVEMALDMIDELCVNIIKAYYLEKMNMKNMAVRFGYKDENSMKKRKSLCLKAARQNLISVNKKTPQFHDRLF